MILFTSLEKKLRVCIPTYIGLFRGKFLDGAQILLIWRKNINFLRFWLSQQSSAVRLFLFFSWFLPPNFSLIVHIKLALINECIKSAYFLIDLHLLMSMNGIGRENDVSLNKCVDERNREGKWCVVKQMCRWMELGGKMAYR